MFDNKVLIRINKSKLTYFYSKWNINNDCDCDFMFYENKNFINKYNKGIELPIYSNNFLEWFESNKSNLTISNKEESIKSNKNTLNDFFNEKNIDANSDLGKELTKIYNDKQKKLQEEIELLRQDVESLAIKDFKER